jgi:UDP-4-amino-4,6-dideoxy-N-acetyl-beta-L-altrosamine transaminase
MSAPKKSFLPYGRQQVDDADIAAVTEVLTGEYLTTGTKVPAFESALASAVGSQHAVACSSGTAALHLAAMALDLKEGDVAVVPTLTFLATANAVRFTDAEVVFADVDPGTGLMRPEDLALALASERGRAAKAVFAVHYAGQTADMAALADVADGVPLVADSCHAIGTRTGNDGRIGDCAHAVMEAFSFHPVKTMAAGEGGAVTTNDSNLAACLGLLRNHGMIREKAAFIQSELSFDAGGEVNPWYYEMEALGYNYRMSDIHGALALSQLGKLDAFIAARRKLVARYDKALGHLAPLVRPLARVADCDPAWHLYVVRIDFKTIGLSRAQVMAALRESGIGSQVHYLPLHMQPYYRQRYGEQSLPGSEAFYNQALSLPLFVGMGDQDVDRVAGALAEILGQGA